MDHHLQPSTIDPPQPRCLTIHIGSSSLQVPWEPSRPWSRDFHNLRKIDTQKELGKAAADHHRRTHWTEEHDYAATKKQEKQARIKSRNDVPYSTGKCFDSINGVAPTQRPAWHAIHASIMQAGMPATKESVQSPAGKRTGPEKALVLGNALKAGPLAKDPAMQPFLGAVRARPGCRPEPFPTREGLVHGGKQHGKNYIPDRRTGK